ncbi:energy transducer TonB [Dyella silvatica]|uniref:energy transducer TonB n=1 Tax=Dyella silvatica TaxID=2992128 RepID=UPI002256EFFA|nr:energy transducer TonB [Dyella silvatica]
MIRRAIAYSMVVMLTACATIPDSPASIDTQYQAANPARYPAQAIRQRHAGTSMLFIEIGADGLVHDVKIFQSSGYQELDQAAIAAAYMWRYKAAIISGHAVASYVHIPVNFHLNDTAPVWK